MPGTARQPRRQVLRGLGVVEHQQPPVPPPQLTEHRPPRRAQVRVRPGAAQLGGQRRDLLPDQPGLLRGDPPHHVIARGEPVRVLSRQLRLAHPAHPLQRLHHRPAPGQQRLPHIGQHLIPAGEPRIARPGHSPTPAAAPPAAAAPPRPDDSAAPAAPGNRGAPAGRAGPATAASSTRRASSSATPNTSRDTSGRSSGGTRSAGTSSTRTGTSRPAATPGMCTSDADHSSVVYRSGSKYAAENSATTRSARASAPLIAVTKFRPAAQSHTSSSTLYPASINCQATHSAHAPSAPA